MTQSQMQPQRPEARVDMSPEAVLHRLEMVGQLLDLCRFLASGTLIPNQDQAATDGKAIEGHRTEKCQATTVGEV